MLILCYVTCLTSSYCFMVRKRQKKSPAVQKKKKSHLNASSNVHELLLLPRNAISRLLYIFCTLPLSFAKK